MSSNESDRLDRRDRGGQADQALAEDRQGRDRLIRLADQQLPASHGEKSQDLPGVRERERL